MAGNLATRRFLAVCGVLVVVYSVCVLGVVVTSSDLRLRWLISDPESAETLSRGVRVWPIEGFEATPGNTPEERDVLLQVARQPVNSYLDLSQILFELYQPPSQPGESNHLQENSDPSELPGLPPIVDIENGPRMVEIVYQSSHEKDAQGNPRQNTTWVSLKSLPVGEILPSLIWFVIQLAIFAVAGLAYWNRPFDRSAQQFYVMCMFSTGAFVGGFHWWIISGSLWLNVPFVVMAMALPAVILHFFLVYPRPIAFLTRHRPLVLSALYAIPAVGIVCVLGLLWYLNRLNTIPIETRPLAHLRETLALLTSGITYYLLLTGAYFLLTLGILFFNLRDTRNRAERGQMIGMLVAGLLASIPIVYSIYLAWYDHVGFVMGHARIPMFLAILFFQTSFAIGILRFKLLLADQFVSRGALYYLSSIALTTLLACVIAFGAAVALQMKISLSTYQIVAVMGILIIAVLLMFWVRDRLQQGIDRRFYQEKYQLDKAFQRMNRAASRFADVETLAEMMFGICREVVQVRNLGLMLASNDLKKRQFLLAASTPETVMPEKIQVGQEFLTTLIKSGMLQRVPSGARHEMSSSQATLRQLNAHLVHALEGEAGIQGLLVLGEKQNGNPYSAEDMAFLQTMCQITSVAVQSLRVQREMYHLNQELQIKLERIGEQNRQIALMQVELDNLQAGESREAAERTDVTEQPFFRGQLKGHSAAMQDLLAQVQKVAQSASSVLVRGESGTGKELLAEVLHDNSPRRDGPLVKVHCAALSPGLLESELFGHVKGAFTGAHEDKMGRFQAAHGGTLFLDEIGDISHETQVKLLRVLQTRSFEPVGSNRTVEVDVRLVAATHQDLERFIGEGKFREDLYYRLNVITLTLPPLRERPDDIAELAVHFLQQAAKRLGRMNLRLSDEALQVLERYSWPGNVRQLENVIERAAVFTEGDVVLAQDLSKEIRSEINKVPVVNHVIRRPLGDRAISLPLSSEEQSSPDVERSGSLAVAADDVGGEYQALLAALERCGGNKSQAARLLGMPRSTFFSKLQKYESS